MGATDVLLSAAGVTVRFSGQSILSDISLNIHTGEIVTLIGPNGAGKTTLLRALLGLQPIDSGTIERNPRVRLGYMPQHLKLSEVLPLTVMRFLRLGGYDAKQCRAALAQTGAGHLADTALHSVSGGELQRILLSRALLHRPDLLVLDEPAQGVDVQGQNELYQLIGGLRNSLGCGVLMVSHDLHLVMAAADTVICLNHHICCEGHPDTVRLNPAYLDLFGATPTPALAMYTHHHDHQHNLHGEVHAVAPDD